MKVCPACNESFADELNFCDIDGARLHREDSARDRNKWWSLLGAGLLVGAVVISATSIFFLPKAHVSAPIVNTETQPAAASPKAAKVESAPAVAASATTPDPERSSTDAEGSELKRKDKAVAIPDSRAPTPNPKAAALSAEEAGKEPRAGEATPSDPSSAKKLEAPAPVKTVTDSRGLDAPPRSGPAPAEVKRDPKLPPTIAKGAEKDSSDKKKTEEKDKKKGGFLRVFKKIFGKD